MTAGAERWRMPDISETFRPDGQKGRSTGETLDLMRSRRRPQIDPNQFRVFALTPDGDALKLTDPHEVEPAISSDHRDVSAAIKLDAFNPAGLFDDENETPQATMRLDIGQNADLDSPLYWAVAAGLQIDEREGAHQGSIDFTPSLSNRRIELTGGIGTLRFNVFAHRRAQAWTRIFRGANKRLGPLAISALGFPGVSEPAVRMVDSLLEQFERGRTVFNSAKSTFAFSKTGRDKLAGPGVMCATLNAGPALLAPHYAYHELAERPLKYWRAYGRLLPAEFTPFDASCGKASELDDVPYAVIDIQLTPMDFQGP